MLLRAKLITCLEIWLVLLVLMCSPVAGEVINVDRTAASGDEIKGSIRDFVADSGPGVTAEDVVSFLNGGIDQEAAAADGDSDPNESVFNPAVTYNISVAALSSEKFVVAYRDNGNSDYGTAVIGEVSGTNIGFGAEFVFNSAHTDEISVAALSSSKFVVAYCDN
ncbi:MAG: hypothetical protein ACYS21_17860, partial [Planctomycetota bacterium]